MSQHGWRILGGDKATGTLNIIFGRSSLVAPVCSHIVFELRSIGYFEINGKDVDGIHNKLGGFLQSLGAVLWDWAGKEPFCDLKFKFGINTVIKHRGQQGENNMGHLTVAICNFMHQNGWSALYSSKGENHKGIPDGQEQIVFGRCTSTKI
jgi:hypothetical protein